MKKLRVLVGCEYSGTVRDAFLALGHDAMSCDLLPSDVGGPHYQGDIFDVIDEGWDIGIFHPPCTYLTNASNKWLYQDGKKHTAAERWELMREGAQFFKRLLDCSIPKTALENPIMHKHAIEIIGRRQDQLVQPWMFGHTERKATCFWLKGLPKLVPTNDVKAVMLKLPKREQQRLHYLPPSADRWKLRSKTFDGIALAMAQQWGK